MTTKEKIIEALLVLASEKGTNNTSMSEIAEAVGITKSSLYFYFPSKDAMLQEMYESFRAKEKKPSSFDPSASVAELLCERLHRYIAMATKGRMAKVFRIIENEKLIDPTAEKLYLQETHLMLEDSASFFRTLEKVRGFSIPNVEETSHLYALYAHELVLLSIMGDLDEEEMKKRIVFFVNRFMEEKL